MSVPKTFLEQMHKHRWLVHHLQDKLHSLRTRYAGQMRCGRGCSRCCYGLFDISLPDAVRVASGLRLLPRQIRTMVAASAGAIQSRLLSEATGLEPPYFLHELPEDRVDRLVDSVGGIRCPFLDERDSCLIYDHRPVACILEGVPMIDLRDGLFGDWCELNFTDGLRPEMYDDFRLDYAGIEAIEGNATVFIPSVVSAIAAGQFTFDNLFF